MSVRLFIRDNTDGSVREYGTDQHDSLVLQEDGSIHYDNLQNGCGTMFPDEGYTFVLSDGSDPRQSEDYIKYGVEPLLDIGGERNGRICEKCLWRKRTTAIRPLPKLFDNARLNPIDDADDRYMEGYIDCLKDICAGMRNEEETE